MEDNVIKPTCSLWSTRSSPRWLYKLVRRFWDDRGYCGQFRVKALPTSLQPAENLINTGFRRGERTIRRDVRLHIQFAFEPFQPQASCKSRHLMSKSHIHRGSVIVHHDNDYKIINYPVPAPQAMTLSEAGQVTETIYNQNKIWSHNQGTMKQYN